MMRLLLAGEDVQGSLLRSLQPGLAAGAHTVTVGLENQPRGRGASAFVVRSANRLGFNRHDRRFVETVHDHRPEVALLLKGRGVTARGIQEARKLGCAVAVYYPDSPLWRSDSAGALERLGACDLVILWSHRLAGALAGARTVVVPFGYDPRWFRPAPPEAGRSGIVFLGTWTRRRERLLRSLTGLPLRVAGSGWVERGFEAATGPVREDEAGRLLAAAAVGVNLLHPQNAGAHNMRTREVAACGALEVTDPGTDGTPLRDRQSCMWFRSPEELRRVVTEALADPSRMTPIARNGQEAVIAETYDLRATQVLSHLETL